MKKRFAAGTLSSGGEADENRSPFTFVSLKIDILGSSSKGNCGLLTVNGSHYLVDAGFSGKQIRERLGRHGLTPADIEGVFLTHEHHDHAAGLKALSKREDVHFFANEKTAQAVEERYEITSQPFADPWNTFETGDTLTFGDFTVQSFSIPHDAADPIGFLFRSEEDCLAWATDIGRLTSKIVEYLSQADTLVLEANHDEELLWRHPHRPQYLKERVAGETGHLSNEDVYKFLQNAPPTLKCVYLVHVSRECNSTNLLRAVLEPLAVEKGFELHIVDPND